MKEITFQMKNNEIECVYYKNCTKSYPLHTHTKHFIIGMVENGNICIIQNGKTERYGHGGKFIIFPNVAHEIIPGGNTPYSMALLCIRVEPEANDNYLQSLWENIIEKPENKLLLEDMSKMINVSKYHLIRQFKKAYGLTPHQFQVQCRVRKAQRLLEENKSTTETAYDTGFFDESHMNRCFKKYVSLTPSEYKASIIRNP